MCELLLCSGKEDIESKRSGSECNPVESSQLDHPVLEIAHIQADGKGARQI